MPYKSITDLLGNMVPHGIYAIGIANELAPFGFMLTGKTLWYMGRSYTLTARTREQQVIAMGEDDASGGLLDNVPDDLMLIDALDLSRAVYVLLTGRNRAPGDAYVGRGFGFKANVREIEIIEQVRRNADA